MGMIDASGAEAMTGRETPEVHLVPLAEIICAHATQITERNGQLDIPAHAHHYETAVARPYVPDPHYTKVITTETDLATVQ